MKFAHLPALCLSTAMPLLAGSYSQNFDAYATATGNATYADGSKLETNASWSGVQPIVTGSTNKALRFTQQPFSGTNAAYRLPNLDAGAAIQEFTVEFRLVLYRGAAVFADGIALNVGANPTTGTGTGELGFTMTNGLRVAFDTHNSGGTDGPAIEVFGNNNQVGQVLTSLPSDQSYRKVSIHWDYSGLDLSYDVNNDGDFADAGEVVFTNLPTPGYAPSVNDTFAFTARTTNGAEDTWLDDLVIATTQATPILTGGPVISEFMAENKGALEDEDVETPDWIEIYNGQASSTNLAGYKLTDGITTWTFPAVTLAPYSYLVVFASGKDRTTTPTLLHTNFSLEKGGGLVSLLSPTDVVLSSFTYPSQYEDVSYGTKFESNTTGFFAQSTPGAAAGYAAMVAADGPAEEVTWDQVGGIISSTTSLSVTPPLAPGSVVRYTLDNSTPSEGSPVYSSAFSISSSTNIRARVYTPGHLPGPVSSRTYLRIDTSLANFNSSGSPFSSNIPIVIFDSFGVNVDAANGTSRPLRYTYAVTIQKDPLTGRAVITSPPDFTGRGGTHVHGESSAGFAQRSYNWELWDNQDQDKDDPVLGMPAGSDWILHGSFSDKTAMRNHLIFSMMREMRSDWSAPRTRQVEVFFNQQAGEPISYSDYKGVYTLMEKITRGKNRLDIARLNEKVIDPVLNSGGYIFKKDKTDAGATAWTTSAPFNIGLQSHEPGLFTTPQLTVLSNYINSFQTVLNGGSFMDLVNGYAAWIDVSSFIDQQLAVEMTKQIDGYVFSTYWHKDRAGKIHAGPAWDFNIALGNANYGQGERSDGWNYDAVGANSNGVGSNWYPRLHADPWYRLRTFDRYWDWRRSVLSNAHFTSRVQTEAATLADGGSLAAITATSSTSLQSPAARHFRRYAPPNLSPALLGGDYWPNPPGFASRTTYQSEIDYLITWMTTRMNWMDNQFLSGTVILRPPNFSLAGGSTPAGSTLAISPYSGTPPAGYTYAAPGTILYTLDGSDPYLASTSTGQETTLIATGAACKWLAPTAGNGGTLLTAGAGTQQWTTYTDPPNISSWNSGATGIGYERDPASTTSYSSLIGAGGNTESQMYNITPTVYMRLSFNIPDQATLDGIGTLRLGIKYDDGFRAYINGAVVAGRNDTDASMTSNPATAQANVIHDDTAAVVEEIIDISASGIPALRVGDNMLALHGLNLPATSSDLIFVPRLTYLPPPNPNTGAQTYTGPLTLNTTTTVKARLRTATGAWTPLTSATYIVSAVPASASNLVVSEIMYHPADPSPAEVTAGFTQSSLFEYIELMNTSAADSADLTNVAFVNGITFNFSEGDPSAIAIPPGGRVLIVSNPAAFALRYGAPPVGVKIAGTWAGNLNNGGEQLRLNDKDGNTLRDFIYDNNEPWPVAPDDAGYSLVLNNPLTNPDHAVAANWRSSAQIGGTPGQPAGPAFAGNPNGDSDGDGYSDFLEFALGSNANDQFSVFPPAGGLQELTVTTTPELYLIFAFRRNNLADGLYYIPELSGDLVTWEAKALVYLSTVQNADGSATVSYRAAAAFATDRRQYVRLRVTP